MDLKEQRKTILKYLSGKATPDEIEWVEAWYKSFEKGSLDAVSIPEEEIEKSKHFILSKVLKSNRYKSIRVLKYAAVLLLIGSCALLIFKSNRNNGENELVAIHTDIKTDTTFKLPDGSVIWLNRNSEIAYNPNTFIIKDRKVYLRKGEAYFEVKRNTSSRFSVVSDNMSVNDIGTGFDVRRDEKAQRLDVMVSHGLVEVAISNKRLSYLKKGESISVDTRNGKFDKKYLNPNYTAIWRANKISLNEASFEELSEIFYSLYKINLISTDARSKKYTYTLVINKQDEFEASLSVITSIHQNNFKQHGNTIIIY